jgi:hypothetical protein
MSRREFPPMVYAEIVRCSIEECDGIANRSARGCRGWCAMHYTRWRRHGDPLATKRTPNGETRSFYEKIVLTYDGDDCLIWPYNRFPSGYGAMYSPTGTTRVSRAVCEDVNGAPPTSTHQAAHSCGKGHLGCVTKRHLSWKTPSQNQLDRIAHGTDIGGSRHPGAKLVDDDIRNIRLMADLFTQRQLGSRFGVSKTMISNILRGKNWGKVL